VSEDILINVTPQETRVAILGSGVVQELLIERAASRGLVGNIYMGRVARVLPGMQSAFVDMGLERAAFLHVADIWEHRKNADEPAPPIERILAEGQPLLVQVVKDPIGTKGARLSTQVSIAGRLLVYLPAVSAEEHPHIGISQRIEDEGGRQQLRDRLKELLPGEEKGGFIVRTLAEAASDEELRADLDYLRHLWGVIRERSAGGGAPAPLRLYQDLSLAQRVLRDMVSAETGRVVIDSRENYQKLAAFAQNYMPQVHGKLEHYIGERPLLPPPSRGVGTAPKVLENEGIGAYEPAAEPPRVPADSNAQPAPTSSEAGGPAAAGGAAPIGIEIGNPDIVRPDRLIGHVTLRRAPAFGAPPSPPSRSRACLFRGGTGSCEHSCQFNRSS